MAKGKALDTLVGSYGKVTAGEEFEVSDEALKQLVKAGLAEEKAERKDAKQAEKAEAKEEKQAEKALKIHGPEKNKAAGPPAVETKSKTPTKD